ncbi:hypothetical protein EB241_01355 [Erwinia psidii]|uniref:Uncharacterized protein n=1 Tax=Erwinia psidii TaxID=69224 RepID=A0A3N6V4E4_9GAMM|nr:hypothetical protein EB241_01355 [Erwinia psidii]
MPVVVQSHGWLFVSVGGWFCLSALRVVRAVLFWFFLPECSLTAFIDGVSYRFIMVLCYGKSARSSSYVKAAEH